MTTTQSTSGAQVCPRCKRRRLVPSLSLYAGDKPVRLFFVLQAADPSGQPDPARRVMGSSPLVAGVCGACGHVELEAQEPDKVWAALVQAEG